jgi:hypothetical protein
MAETVLGVTWALIWPPAFASGWRALTRGRTSHTFWGAWINASSWVIVSSALTGDRPYIAAAAANFLFGLVMWWLSRRRRKRSPKLAGAKSRARLASLVRSMRERAKPRPVLRPVPGGARA